MGVARTRLTSYQVPQGNVRSVPKLLARDTRTSGGDKGRLLVARACTSRVLDGEIVKRNTRAFGLPPSKIANCILKQGRLSWS